MAIALAILLVGGMVLVFRAGVQVGVRKSFIPPLVFGFDKGYELGWKEGISVGVDEPVSEARRLMIVGSREMGILVPVELSGGELDGASVEARLGDEAIKVSSGDREHIYVWACRTSAKGKRWVYEWQGTETLNSKI